MQDMIRNTVQKLEENRQSEIIENVKKAINGENFCEEKIFKSE